MGREEPAEFSRASGVVAPGTAAQGDAAVAASQLTSREMRKLLEKMRGGVSRPVAILRFSAGDGARAESEGFPAGRPDTRPYTRRVPVGVVGLIIPWIIPASIPVWKMAPVLARGKTVVWKPAEFSSLTACQLAKLLVSVLGPGIANAVIGEGPVVGAALAHGAQCQLELGGKNPAIVLDDANLASAVDPSSRARCPTGGLCCRRRPRQRRHGDCPGGKFSPRHHRAGGSGGCRQWRALRAVGLRVDAGLQDGPHRSGSAGGGAGDGSAKRPPVSNALPLLGVSKPRAPFPAIRVRPRENFAPICARSRCAPPRGRPKSLAPRGSDPRERRRDPAQKSFAKSCTQRSEPPSNLLSWPYLLERPDGVARRVRVFRADINILCISLWITRWVLCELAVGGS